MGIDKTGFWYTEDKVINGHLLVPSVCNWIINFLKEDKNYPLYDFGCGVGHYLKKFSEAGYTKLTGFEGMKAINSDFDNIVEQNLTELFTVPEPGNVVCLEVGEHIPAEHMDTLLTNLANACNKYLILSWAVRGQDFEGHVNCLDNHEVIPHVLAKGFEFLPTETKSVKDANNDYLHFKSTMVFRKK